MGVNSIPLVAPIAGRDPKVRVLRIRPVSGQLTLARETAAAATDEPDGSTRDLGKQAQVARLWRKAPCSGITAASARTLEPNRRERRGKRFRSGVGIDPASNAGQAPDSTSGAYGRMGPRGGSSYRVERATRDSFRSWKPAGCRENARVRFVDCSALAPTRSPSHTTRARPADSHRP